MITLGLDTTATAASVALTKDGQIISEFYTNVGLQHSRTLMPMIESLLSCCGTSLTQVDRFGVTAGPGSFTGVRIGVAAVKGMALPDNVPCVGLSTLEVLAHNMPENSYLICPVMDARCGQVYNALFAWERGRIIRLCEDRAITVTDLQKELAKQNRSVVWVGDGAKLCFDTLADTNGHVLAPEPLRLQHAAHVALLAEKAIQTVSPNTLEVSYLRPPQAVRARMEKQ